MPTFKSDIVANAPDDITTYCGENTECIYDYSVSGSQDVAAATLWSNENYEQQETQACMLSKVLYCMCIIIGKSQYSYIPTNYIWLRNI